jgi:Tfp pilus assembly PilM family ATPase
MPQTLILYWDRRRIAGLIAEGDAGPRILQSFDQAWIDSSEAVATPTQQSERLRSCLPAGSAPERVIICLPREDVILRQVDVPDVPDEDLAPLVGFQAAGKSSQPLEQLHLDFLPVPKSPGHDGRSVLAVTAPKTTLAKIQGVLKGAGLEAAVVTFNTAGLAEFVCQTEQQVGDNGSPAVLAIFREAARIEVVILKNRHVIYGHAARVPGESPEAAAILSEASRALVAAGQLHHGLSIHHAWVCGNTEGSPDLSSRLAERLGAPVNVLDPASARWIECPKDHWAERPATTAALLGLAVPPAARLTLPFDLLHPRQPPKKVDIRKLRLAAGSAAALVLAAFFMGAIGWTKVRLQAQIDDLQKQESKLNDDISLSNNAVEKAQVVDAWESGNLDQIQHLATLHDLMGGTDRLYLTQYEFTAGQGDPRGHLISFVNAKALEDIKQLNERLADNGYRIQPRELNQFSRDDEYPNRFELNANLMKKSTDASAKRH